MIEGVVEFEGNGSDVAERVGSGVDAEVGNGVIGKVGDGIDATGVDEEIGFTDWVVSGVVPGEETGEVAVFSDVVFKIGSHFANRKYPEATKLIMMTRIIIHKTLLFFLFQLIWNIIKIL